MPDEGLDDATSHLVAHAAEPHDDTPEKQIRRWIGGTICAVEDWLSGELPEGWYAKIEEEK